MKITKNNKKLLESIDILKTYEPIEAIKILKENTYAKFDETLEILSTLSFLQQRHNTVCVCVCVSVAFLKPVKR